MALRSGDKIVKTVFLLIGQDYKTPIGGRCWAYLVLQAPSQMPILTKLITTTNIWDSDYTTVDLDEREEHRIEKGVDGDAEASIS